MKNMYEQKISIIIPAYNEGENIYNNLSKMEEMFDTFLTDYELIVVNDGSKDNSKEEIERAEKDMKHVIAAGYDENRGKGGAIREGVEQARGEYIAFLDADLDLSPMHLEVFMKKILETDATAVIGSKLHKDSKVDYPLPRRIMSVGYYLLLKLLFHLKIKDTQTGVKLFKANELKRAMEKVTSNGFAYDIEILALITVYGGKINEMPIELVFQRNNGWGRIKISDIIEVVKETAHIYTNVHNVRRMIS